MFQKSQMKNVLLLLLLKYLYNANQGSEECLNFQLKPMNFSKLYDKNLDENLEKAVS